MLHQPWPQKHADYFAEESSVSTIHFGTKILTVVVTQRQTCLAHCKEKSLIVVVSMLKRQLASDDRSTPCSSNTWKCVVDVIRRNHTNSSKEESRWQIYVLTTVRFQSTNTVPHYSKEITTNSACLLDMNQIQNVPMLQVQPLPNFCTCYTESQDLSNRDPYASKK